MSPLFISIFISFNNILFSNVSSFFIPKLHLENFNIMFFSFNSLSSILSLCMSLVFKKFSILFIDIRQFNNDVMNIGNLYNGFAIESNISIEVNKFSIGIFPYIVVKIPIVDIAKNNGILL